MAAAAAASRPTEMMGLTSNTTTADATDTATAPANNDEGVDLEATNSIKCIICLDTVPKDSRAAQRCSHDVCKECFSKYLTVTIMDSCVGFPRCPEPNCTAAASDELISACTTAEVSSRMRQLRGLHPARAKDGRRMWCVAPGCTEPLAPPIVEIANGNGNGNNNNANDNNDAGNANNNNNSMPIPRMHNHNHPIHNRSGNINTNNNETAPPPDPPPPLSECGKCGTVACLRCGAAAHHGKPCSAPTTCLRQQRMYAQYAVDRIAPCSQCGAHVERNGGCSQMVCGICSHSFTFRPFTNVRQVQESLAFSAGTVPPPPPPQRRQEVLGRLMALHRAGPDGQIFDPLDGLGINRMARRNTIGYRAPFGNGPGRNRREMRAQYHRLPGTLPDSTPGGIARANANFAATMAARAHPRAVHPPPPPPRPVRLGGSVRRTHRAPATMYDYMTDEEMDFYDPEFDLIDPVDDPFGMPRNPHGARGPAAGRADAMDAVRPLPIPVEQTPQYMDVYRGRQNRRRMDLRRVTHRLEAATARRMEQGRNVHNHAFHGHAYDDGDGPFGYLDMWPDPVHTEYPQRLGGMDDDLTVFGGGNGTLPRRRASTGAAEGTGTVRRREVEPARTTQRRRTLSDLEGATMPPPSLRRRTSADGATGATEVMRVATVPGNVNGRERNVRFAAGERSETDADAARMRRREAMRRELRRRSDPARRFGTEGGLPDPEL